MAHGVFYVPDKHIGRIIGPGGKHIKEIQESFNVKIDTGFRNSFRDTNDDSPLNSMIEVAGATDEAVEGARGAIQELIKIRIGTVAFHKVEMDELSRSALGKLRANKFELVQKIREDNLLVDFQLPGKENHLTCPYVEGTIEDCLRAVEQVKDALDLGSLGYRDLSVAEPNGALVVPEPPRYNLQTRSPIRKVLFFPSHIEQDRSHPEEEHAGQMETKSVMLKYLDSARKTIDVCVFTISDDNIAKRLLDAHRHHRVRVRIISDDECAKNAGSDIEEFRNAGIEVALDNDSEAHMHHKFAILDGTVLLNGSFNWTKGACETNEENMMITNDVVFVEQFQSCFTKLWKKFYKA